MTSPELKDGQVLRMKVLKLFEQNDERLVFILSEHQNGVKFQVSWSAVYVIDDAKLLEHIMLRLQEHLENSKKQY